MAEQITKNEVKVKATEIVRIVSCHGGGEAGDAGDVHGALEKLSTLYQKKQKLFSFYGKQYDFSKSQRELPYNLTIPLVSTSKNVESRVSNKSW